MITKESFYYKGFIVEFIHIVWRADAYANPQFTDPNKAKLKKAINQYLNK